MMIKALKSCANKRLRYHEVYTSSEDETTHAEDEPWPEPLEDSMSGDQSLDLNSNPVNESDKVEEGDWVVVIYDQDWYPGIVDRRDENFLSVNFMSKTGIKFFWPSPPDILTVEADSILCKVDSPLFPSPNVISAWPKIH
ncbi:uncharacterized protein LOC124360580 [Homalodisca vitripennis]|uniref:uncharacterized protein LOC124360580 n=1 Tax=Homalodisca vitripennis TaxID=197043 RepID=UPI001EE9DBE8|nr:uncharacterized protein LOC124360580 [Homalodisca vitripennis]